LKDAMIDRRLLLKLALLSLPASLATPSLAFARDGGSNGGDDGGGDDGGSDGGDDGGNDGSDDGNSDASQHGLSQDEVLRQARAGKIIALKTALAIVGAKVHGKVIDVKLTQGFTRPYYQVKVRRDDGVIKSIRLDARTGHVVSFFGF
jgi:hypothetical protein